MFFVIPLFSPSSSVISSLRKSLKAISRIWHLLPLWRTGPITAALRVPGSYLALTVASNVSIKPTLLNRYSYQCPPPISLCSKSFISDSVTDVVLNTVKVVTAGWSGSKIELLTASSAHQHVALWFAKCHSRFRRVHIIDLCRLNLDVGRRGIHIIPGLIYWSATTVELHD